MHDKESFSDYTRAEFMELISSIKDDQLCIRHQLGLIMHFSKIIQHPERASLIYGPDIDTDNSIEDIIQTIEEWRAAQGLPGLKE